jgi:hypothetical protein
VKNRLHVVKGGKHGGFDAEELSESFRIIWEFLDEVVGNPGPGRD